MKIVNVSGNSNLINLNSKANAGKHEFSANPSAVSSFSGDNSLLSLTALKNYNLHLVSFKGRGADKVKSMLSNDSGIEALNEVDKFSQDEKKEFVREYCSQTGFPNLPDVNKKMLSHAKEQIMKASANTGIPVLWSGYHKHCSASKGLAVPGSDIDALCVIVDENQQDSIGNFKGELWRGFNPLLVSIRKDYEFPDVFSINQLHQWTKLVDEVAIKNGLNQKTGKYKANLKEKDDYNKALEFNIDITACLEKENVEHLKQKAPACKQLLDNDEKPNWITHAMSSLLESLRSGKTLISQNLNEEQRKKMEDIKNSYIYNFGNICIQDADYDVKPKLQERRVINNSSFAEMNLDTQVDLIKRMIYESHPSREKTKLSEVPGKNFDKMFSNGEDMNKKRDEAFQKCV